MATAKEELYMKKFSEVQERCEKLEASNAALAKENETLAKENAALAKENAALAKENETLRMQLAQPRESPIPEKRLVEIVQKAIDVEVETIERARRQMKNTATQFLTLKEYMEDFCEDAKAFTNEVNRFNESVTPISVALTGAVKQVLDTTDIRMSPEAEAEIDSKTRRITDGLKMSLDRFADDTISRIRKEDDGIRLNATFLYILVVILFTLTAYFGITAYSNFSLWHHADLTSVFWWCTGLSFFAIGTFLTLKHFFIRQR